MMLPTRRLGTTGISVTELGFGAAPLGNLYRALGDSEARATAIAALDAGIGYFDTAPFYGFGASERRLGDVLRGRKGVVLSTKVGRLLKSDTGIDCTKPRDAYHSPMPFHAVFDYSFDGVMSSWEASKQRLGLAHIDILYVHDIGRVTHANKNEMRFRQLTDGGGFRALEELRACGEIGAFGLGVNEIPACLDALAHTHLDVILLAGRYTLLEQDALLDLLPACVRSGTSVIVGGPYNSGILATGTRLVGDLKYDYRAAPDTVITRVRCLESHCDRYGVPLAAAALQLPLAHPQVACVIPGLDSAQRIEETLALYRTPIPSALWESLKHSGLLHAGAPVPVPRNT